MKRNWRRKLRQFLFTNIVENRRHSSRLRCRGRGLILQEGQNDYSRIYQRSA